MNRREFFAGLSATVAVAITPAMANTIIAAAPKVEWVTWFEQWQHDALDVLFKCWEDQLIYGVSAYQHTDVYPFVERIDPLTLELPHLRRGLL